MFFRGITVGLILGLTGWLVLSALLIAILR
jgi:hypothetical protein